MERGIRIKLLGQPFEILAVLLSKPGQLVTREELRSRLWPADTFVDFNHGLNAAMNKLRDALCDSADNPRYIETLPRRGYRFIATVKRVQGREDTNIAGSEPAQVMKLPIVAPEGKSAADTISIANAVPESSPIRHKRRFSTVQITLILLSIAALGYFTWVYRWQNSRAPKIGRRASITPVPLTDLADPTSDPAFSPDGTRVAFRRQGYSPESSGIFVKTIGSHQLVQLTNNPADCCPAWGPSGRAIAFSRFSDKQCFGQWAAVS